MALQSVGKLKYHNFSIKLSYFSYISLFLGDLIVHQESMNKRILVMHERLTEKEIGTMMNKINLDLEFTTKSERIYSPYYHLKFGLLKMECLTLSIRNQ